MSSSPGNTSGNARWPPRRFVRNYRPKRGYKHRYNGPSRNAEGEGIATSVVQVPPVSLWARFQGIRRLVAALDACWTTDTDVVLDFGGCEFLTAEAVAVLAGVVALRNSRGLQTSSAGFAYNGLKRNLSKMGFLELLGERTRLPPDNSLPIYMQDEYDSAAVMRYIQNQVMDRPQMPTMSPPLSKEIRRSFVEIFGNVFHHSASAIGGLVCGQVYPNKKEIQLTFFDTGVGIAARVRDHVKGAADDSTAIRWALERGNSTLSLSEGHPRGLGLFLLREFLRVNGGELQVYANEGYYWESGIEHRTDTLWPALPGTLLDLRIRVSESVSYYLADEPTD